MNPQDAIDLGREAVKACLMVGKPMTHFNVPAADTQISSARVAENSGPFNPSTQLPSFDSEKVPAKLPKLDDPANDSRSPFMLPQHRYSRLPKENIDG